MTNWLGFELLRPELLPWSLGAPLVCLAGLWAVERRRATLARLGEPRFVRQWTAGLSWSRARLRVCLATAAALLLGCALLGPARGSTLREVKQKGIDLVLCIDTSRSMLARDLRPDRLTRARREIQGLLKTLQGDRVALIAFAGDAREVAPLTRDRSALESLLEQLTPDDNRLGGTDLAAALERALALFDGRTGAHEAIVLLTDGEDLTGKGLEAARKARERNIRVYVVGMGTVAGGKIPVPVNQGREGFLKDREGVEVVSQLAGETLKKLAESTGGDYLSAEQSPTPLEDLYRLRISRLERRALEQGLLRIPHDRFQWALGAGLACLLAELLLSERRAAPRRRTAALARRRARKTVEPLAGAARAVLAAWALGATLAAGGARAQESAPSAPAWTGSVALGLSEIRSLAEKGEHERALALAQSLLERAGQHELPERSQAELLYSTGLLLQHGQQTPAALRAFQSARVLAGPGELRLAAGYNAGCVQLAAAERAFGQYKQLAQSGAQPLAPGTGPGGARATPGPGPAPDPAQVLGEAKAAYLAARALLLERLKLAGRDVDTRANLELCLRRLREIESIERQNEQQQEQDPQDQQNQDPSESQPSDPKKQDQQPNQSQPKPEKDEKDSSEPKDGQEQPGEQQKEQEPEQPKDQQPGQEQPPPEESKEAQQKEPAGSQPTPIDLSKLSREEIQQILDKLEELEKQAEALRAALRKTGRKPVEKDW